MVLSYEKTKQVLKSKSDYFNYLVLDTQKIPSGEDKERFGQSVQLLNLKRQCIEINSIYEKMEKDRRLDYSIIDKAMGAILEKRPLDNESLLTYVNLRKEISQFLTMYDSLFRNPDYLNPEVDLILIGKNHDLVMNDIPNRLVCHYEPILMDFLFHDLTADEFIEQAQELIENFEEE